MSEHEISQDILIAEYEAVYYYVLSLCHNSSEAEDITQETFCRALYKKTEFKGNSSIVYLVVCHCQKYLVEGDQKRETQCVG